MYSLRAGRKPYNRHRPLEETGYPVRRPEMTSRIGRRVDAAAACSGRREVRRRLASDDDGGDRSGSTLDDVEVRRALEAVNFVAAHLKNDDEFAEVSVILLRSGGTGVNPAEILQWGAQRRTQAAWLEARSGSPVHRETGLGGGLGPPRKIMNFSLEMAGFCKF